MLVNLRGGVWEVGVSSTAPGMAMVGTGSVETEERAQWKLERLLLLKIASGPEAIFRVSAHSLNKN